MKVTISNIPNTTEGKQQELGQALLITMCHVGIEIKDVRIELTDEENK